MDLFLDELSHYLLALSSLQVENPQNGARDQLSPALKTLHWVEAKQVWGKSAINSRKTLKGLFIMSRILNGISSLSILKIVVFFMGYVGYNRYLSYNQLIYLL